MLNSRSVEKHSKKERSENLEEEILKQSTWGMINFMQILCQFNLKRFFLRVGKFQTLPSVEANRIFRKKCIPALYRHMKASLRQHNENYSPIMHQRSSLLDFQFAIVWRYFGLGGLRMFRCRYHSSSASSTRRAGCAKARHPKSCGRCVTEINWKPRNIKTHFDREPQLCNRNRFSQMSLNPTTSFRFASTHSETHH